ncbi:MAG: hypothetical protein WCF84_20575 [Anaerolineae bacterium]
MIIGIIPDVASAETLLNNLAEADFDRKSISVILKDLKLRARIAADTGPFKGVNAANLAARLAKMGLSGPDAQAYVDAVNNGAAFVAIAPPAASQAAAVEMMNDYKPQLVKVIP